MTTKTLSSFSFLEQKEAAIKLYKEGICELERGINIDVWQGQGEKWMKAQRLHDKMQTNLAMAKDRLHFLGESTQVLLLIAFLIRCSFSCAIFISRPSPKHFFITNF